MKWSDLVDSLSFFCSFFRFRRPSVLQKQSAQTLVSISQEKRFEVGSDGFNGEKAIAKLRQCFSPEICVANAIRFFFFKEKALGKDFFQVVVELAWEEEVGGSLIS